MREGKAEKHNKNSNSKIFTNEKKSWIMAVKLSLIFLGMTLLYAVMYMLFQKLDIGDLVSTKKIEVQDYFYFSFVTITTLGYGDITPAGLSKYLACSQVVFGLIFVGYSLSQVLSARQEYLIEYLTTDRILQTYGECLAKITDAKELIGDHRRDLNVQQPNPMLFIYNRGNPFYPALNAMAMLNGYTEHVKEIGRAPALSSQVERAAHHVEELASFARKYLNILKSKRVTWRTRRTVRILKELCDAIEKFANSYTEYTRYAKEEYKGGGNYQKIVQLITSEIRNQL